MPAELERKLKKEVAGKKMSKDRKDAYVYGTLRKTGWKPKREREKNLSAELDGLIQFKKRDELAEIKEREHQGRASAAGLLFPSLGQTAVGVGTIGAVSKFRNTPIANRDRALMHRLNIEASKAGGDVHETMSPMHSGVAWRKQGRGWMARAQRKQVAEIIGKTNPPDAGVAISPSVRKPLKPGVLAHEIGHLKQPKWMTSAEVGTIGQWGPLGTSLYSGITGDEKRAKVSAIAGTAAAAPMLYREIDASVRGGKLLAKHGVKGIRRLSPGIGLATYATVAAMPGATYATKKAFGGYKTKEMSALLDDLIEFKEKKSSKQRVLGIPGLTYQSRRDPEERLRDRLSIAASTAKTAAGLGIATAAGVGAYQIHKHGKGILGEARQAIQGAGKIGPSIEAINQKLDRAESWATKVGGDPAARETVETFAKAASFAKRHPRIARFLGKHILASSTEKLIEFGQEILGPWQGPSGHESKIDQLEFPAGMSPAAVLALPFPQLMAYLNQRNMLQQVFSSPDARIVRLNSKLSDVIEFAGLMSTEAIENVFGKLGSFGKWGKKLGGAAETAAGDAAGAVTTAARTGINPTAATGATKVRSPSPMSMPANVPTGESPLTKFYKAQKEAAFSGTPAATAPMNAKSMSMPANVPTSAQKVAGPVSSTDAQKVAQQAGQNASGQTAGNGSVGWKNWSTGRKLAVGAGAGLAAGGAAAYALQPRDRDQQFSKWLDDVIEFAGGYVNTAEGVKKERGVGAHFNRAAGRYIGTGVGGVLLGLPIGYFVDRSRRKNNILKTKFEPKQPWLSKGQVLSAKLNDLIAFADPRPRNTLGEFTQQEGGPDPNAMATTYKNPGPGLGPALAVGAAGGVAGEGGAMAYRKILDKIKKAKLKR